MRAFFEEKGQRENYLRIDSANRTKWGLPATRVHFSRTDESVRSINKWLRRMEKIVESMGYKIATDKSEAFTPGGHHSTGTCRMAASPEQGVTDGDLRVHGTENLYVCSNAVFPTVSAVNPTLTLTALAMRLSEHLIGLDA